MSSGEYDSNFFPNQILKQHGYPQDQAAQQYLQDQAAKHQAAMQEQVIQQHLSQELFSKARGTELTIREAHGGWILTRRSWPWELVFTDWEKLIAAISEHFPERSKDGTAGRDR